MRVVYGAGAFAAVSVMAVGLVKPSFVANAEQPALPTTQESTEESVGPRVVRYVYLRPGQRAPEGATVITARQADRRLGEVPNTRNGRRSNPPATQQDQPATQPGRPASQPDRAPQQQPQPDVTTRQSGG